LAKYNKARKNVINLHSTALKKEEIDAKSFHDLFLHPFPNILHVWIGKRKVAIDFEKKKKKEFNMNVFLRLKNVPPEDFLKKKKSSNFIKTDLMLFLFGTAFFILERKGILRKKRKRKK